MIIKEKSFLYKFITLWGLHARAGYSINNFCQAFWRTVRAFLIVAIIEIVAVGAIYTSWLLWNDYTPPQNNFLLMVAAILGFFAVVIIGALLALAGIVGIIIGIGWLWDKGTGGKPIISQETKENVSTVYRSWKDKYCPTVTVERE